jgi:hypothetical protein
VPDLHHQKTPLTPACPHCGAECELVMETVPGSIKYSLKIPGDRPSYEEVQINKGRREKAERELQAARNRINTARQVLVAARLEAVAAEKATEELRDLEGRQGGADVESARRMVATAEGRLKAFSARQTARRKHLAIETNQKLIDIAAPDGLRKRKLGDVLSSINERMAPLCKDAGFEAVEIQDDLSVTYGGRPVELRSRGEQFRARTILQVLMALMDGSDVLVVDGADILDQGGRNGLFTLLPRLPFKSVVTMTIGRKAAPDLEKAGLGTTVWLQEGAAHALAA